MRSFAQLVHLLGTSTKTNERLDILSRYFIEANQKDKVWVIALFTGRRPKRMVNSTQLWQWCAELTNLPQWLFAECYHNVGDLAETISLVLPEKISYAADTSFAADAALHTHIEQMIALQKADETVRKNYIISAWQHMNTLERFVFTKLITGNFRIGISQGMMINALARTSGVSPAVIAHRISGNWDPGTISFDDLTSASDQADVSKPYPFYLAYPLQDTPSKLGEPSEWQAEWKWDGIRGQIIKRDNQLFVWSRGEELITEKFPEYQSILPLLPEGCVIDGEILPFDGSMPLPFSALQTRIGRKNVTQKQLREVPVAFFAYDMMECEGNDIRIMPLSDRRSLLEKLVEAANSPILRLSPSIHFETWDNLALLRESARDMGSEGLMLKRMSSAYQQGRKVGDWWKWKIDPLVIDAVMVYAQKGSGRRSNLYTDYTFAVRDGEQLVTFAKAYSGLTDKEFAEVDAFVKRNSIEKFGPVRTVKPELVFEIAFEGIAESKRHKSGVALRFPRMNRWRKDKSASEINTLDDLKEMLRMYGK